MVLLALKAPVTHQAQLAGTVRCTYRPEYCQYAPELLLSLSLLTLLCAGDLWICSDEVDGNFASHFPAAEVKITLHLGLLLLQYLHHFLLLLHFLHLNQPVFQVREKLRQSKNKYETGYTNSRVISLISGSLEWLG